MQRRCKWKKTHECTQTWDEPVAKKTRTEPTSKKCTEGTHTPDVTTHEAGIFLDCCDVCAHRSAAWTSAVKASFSSFVTHKAKFDSTYPHGVDLCMEAAIVASEKEEGVYKVESILSKTGLASAGEERRAKGKQRAALLAEAPAAKRRNTLAPTLLCAPSGTNGYLCLNSSSQSDNAATSATEFYEPDEEMNALKRIRETAQHICKALKQS